MNEYLFVIPIYIFFLILDPFSPHSSLSPVHSAHVLHPKMGPRTKTATGRFPRSSLALALTSRSLRLPMSWGARFTPRCPWQSYQAEITPVSIRRWHLTPSAMSSARNGWRPKMWAKHHFWGWMILKVIWVILKTDLAKAYNTYRSILDHMVWCKVKVSYIYWKSKAIKTQKKGDFEKILKGLIPCLPGTFIKV